MKRQPFFRSIFLLVALSFVFTSRMSAQPFFQTSYFTERLGSVVQLKDSNLLISGAHPINADFGGDVLLCISDQNGQFQQGQTFSLGTNTYVLDLIQASNGDFVGAGIIKGTGSGNEIDGLVIAFDSTQAFKWATGLDIRKNDILLSVTETTDGNYLVAGRSDSILGQGHPWLAKFSPSGQKIWSSYFPQLIRSEFTDVIPTPDNGCLAVGFYPDSAGLRGLWVRVNAQGSILALKQFNDDSDRAFYQVAPTDNGFVLAGSSFSPDKTAEFAYLAQTDTSGNIQWEIETGGKGLEKAFLRLVADGEGGWVAAGRTFDQSGGTENNGEAYYLRTDSLGNPMWFTSLDIGDEDEVLSLIRTSPGSFSSIIVNNDRSLAVQLDRFGNAGCNPFPNSDTLFTPFSRVVDTSFLFTSTPDSLYTLSATRSVYSPRTQVICGGCEIPLANFNSQINELSVNFSDASQFSDSVKWFTGTGDTLTGRQASYTYPAFGTYRVCQVAFNSCGSDTFCQDVTVSCTLPVALFSYTDSALQAKFLYEGQGDRWIWSFGDGNVSNQQNPTHQFAVADTYTVCLVVFNNCGSDSFCQEVIIGDPLLGRWQPLAQIDLRAYPNPTNGRLFLDWKQPFPEPLQLSIFDLSGRKVKVIEQVLPGMELSLHDLPKGLYVLRLGNLPPFRVSRL
ncbi:MAG: PKD domain-containing protein [Bacteroidota bacterium]